MMFVIFVQIQTHVSHFVNTVPGPPEGVKAIQTSAKTILVSWKPPARSNGLIVKYDLEIRAKTRGKHPEKHIKTIPGRKTTHVLQDASSGRVYEFAVAASTSIGQGTFSSSAQLSLESNSEYGIFNHSLYTIVM
jgi:Down syndrome cell adhesion protein 1